MRKTLFTTILLFNVSVYLFAQQNKILLYYPETINGKDVLIKWTILGDSAHQNLVLSVKNAKNSKIILESNISKVSSLVVPNLIESTAYEYCIKQGGNLISKPILFKLASSNSSKISNSSNTVEYVYITDSNDNIISQLTLCNGTNTTLYHKVFPENNANLSYQWTKNGIDLPGETNASLVTSGIASYGLKVTQNNVSYNSFYSVNLEYSSVIYAGPSVRGATVQCLGRSSTMFSNYNTQTAVYQWSKNGVNIPGAIYKTYQTTESGAYELNVQDNGCTFYQTRGAIRLLFGNELYPNIYKIDSLYCEGGRSVLIQDNNLNNNGFTFQWMKNGVNIPNATNPVYSANSEGIYSLRMSQDNCSSVSAGVKITKITEYPKAVITYNHTDICLANTVAIGFENQSRDYQWKRNGVDLIGENASKLVISQTGSYRCVISSFGLCPTLSDEITVTNGTNLNPKIEFEQVGKDCNGIYLRYKDYWENNLSNLTFQWVINGNNISNATNFFYYATNSGSYQLRVTNTITGCTALSNVLNPVISTIPDLVIDKTYVGPVCKNTIASLGVSKWRSYQTTYQWKKDGVNIPNEIYDNIYIKSSGNYSVIFTSGNCSAESVQVPVKIDSIPSVSLSGNSNLLLNQFATLPLTLTGGADYAVTLNDNVTHFLNSSATTIQKQPLVNTTYSISGFANHCGVGTFSGSHIVNILSCPLINTINNTLSTTITLKASEKINGQNLIQTGANVRYSAKKSVIMLPPFKTEIGATFQADTEGCDN